VNQDILSRSIVPKGNGRAGVAEDENELRDNPILIEQLHGHVELLDQYKLLGAHRLSSVSAVTLDMYAHILLSQQPHSRALSDRLSAWYCYRFSLPPDQLPSFDANEPVGSKQKKLVTALARWYEEGSTILRTALLDATSLSHDEAGLVVGFIL